MSDVGYEARVTGVGKPKALEVLTGRLRPGRYDRSDFVRFDGATVEGVDFSGLTFDYIGTEGSTFTDCDFSRVRIDAGSLAANRTSRFVGCRFDGIRPGALLWGTSRFEACSFANLRLKDWEPDSAEFINCQFSGHIEGMVVCGIPQWPYNRPDRLSPWRTRNEFHGNDFTGVDLRTPDFRFGVDLAANSWPTGPQYLFLDRWQERLVRALADVARWPDAAERERALWWLQFNRSDGRDQQTSGFVRKSDWEDIKPTAVWPRLWATLARPAA